MPEQNDKIRLDYIIGSGFFTFSAICVLLSSVFHGNFPELIPAFLVFFFAMMLGSCFGFKTESLPVRYCELLFGFSALFFFSPIFLILRLLILLRIMYSCIGFHIAPITTNGSIYFFPRTLLSFLYSSQEYSPFGTGFSSSFLG